MYFHRTILLPVFGCALLASPAYADIDPSKPGASFETPAMACAAAAPCC